MKISQEIPLYKDTNLSLEQRKIEYQKILEKQMNPKAIFDPLTFDPFDDDEDYEVKKRVRKEIVGKFNTMGMHPKEIIPGQMIGMGESKQDIYLMFANKINNLIDEIDELKKQVNLLSKN